MQTERLQECPIGQNVEESSSDTAMPQEVLERRMSGSQNV
jgi:hypothetical protein